MLAMATTVRGLGDIGFRGHEISWVAVWARRREGGRRWL